MSHLFDSREECWLRGSGYLTDDEIRHGLICSLNPNIDTAPAILGNEDPAKVCIQLYKPPFGTAYEPMSLEYGVEVHWERESSIRNLNRWRAAMFLHYLGLGLVLCKEPRPARKRTDLVAQYCNRKVSPPRMKKTPEVSAAICGGIISCLGC